MSEAITQAARSWRVSFVFVVAVSACGSNDDGGDKSEFHSRVAESKALGSLTPAEQSTLCEDVASWTTTLSRDPDYIAAFCKFSAVTTASLDASLNQLTVEQMRDACRTAESQCMSQQSMAMPLPSSMGCAYPASCTATVGDLKDCTVGTFEGSLALWSTIPSCDAVQLDTLSNVDYSSASNTAAACTKVTACGPPS